MASPWCFICVFLLPVTPVFPFRFGFQILYDNNDPLTILNITNFKSTVYEDKKTWIVEFYNTWCGHCVQFAPTWKQLARDTIGWRSVMDVAVIDCAVEANVPTCREFSVTGYPTIRFFPVQSKEGQFGVGYNGTRNISDIRHGMVDFIQNQTENLPSLWPVLQPLGIKQLEEAWSKVSPTVKGLAFIIEEENSYTGREVILDMFRVTNVLRVFRISSKNQPLVDNLRLNNQPAMILIDRKGSKKTYDEVGNSRDGFVHDLEEYVKAIDPKLLTEPSTHPPLEVEEGAGEKPHLEDESDAIVDPTDLDKVYTQDLENTLYYLLKQEVALSKVIDGEKLQALRDFLVILDKYYPGREAVRSFLRSLRIWVNDRTSSITAETLINKVDGLQEKEKSNLKMRKWLGCQGSAAHLRGYPCGLWTLFHALTVSAYTRFGRDQDFDPLEVLAAIRGYVTNFFSCEECANHFREMSANLAEEVRTNEDSVLWLWQAHNKVNQRLKGSASEDPIHPKVQFPMESHCPNCQIVNSEGGTQWELPSVLAFLTKHYSNSIGMQQHLSENSATDLSVRALLLVVSVLTLAL